MANVHRGEVEIELDKKRILKYTTSSIVKVEKELNKPIHLLGETVGIYELSVLFWGALLHENKNLTQEEAMSIMDYGDMIEIAEKIMEAFNLVFQKGSEAGKN